MRSVVSDGCEVIIDIIVLQQKREKVNWFIISLRGNVFNANSWRIVRRLFKAESLEKKRVWSTAVIKGRKILNKFPVSSDLYFRLEKREKKTRLINNSFNVDLHSKKVFGWTRTKNIRSVAWFGDNRKKTNYRDPFLVNWKQDRKKIKGFHFENIRWTWWRLISCFSSSTLSSASNWFETFFLPKRISSLFFANLKLKWFCDSISLYLMMRKGTKLVLNIYHQ